VSGGEGAGGVQHHRGGPARIERALGEHVRQRLAADPLQHDVGDLAAVLDIEYLGKPGIVKPGRGPGGGHDLVDPREAGGEGEDRNRPGQRLVGCFPVRPAGTPARLVDEAVPPG
jgi:hypothetical protein